MTQREIHLLAVYPVLHYLKAHPVKGILIKKTSDIALAIYTDADFIGSLLDKWSTTSYYTFLERNLLSQRSNKQNVVARSGAEMNFRTMATKVYKLLWFKIIIDDLKVQWIKPMKLFVIANHQSSFLISPCSMTEQNTQRQTNTSSKKSCIVG